MKKVLVISTSLRGVSNSHELAEAFARGAKEAGNEVELMRYGPKCMTVMRGLQVGRQLDRFFSDRENGLHFSDSRTIWFKACKPQRLICCFNSSY